MTPQTWLSRAIEMIIANKVAWTVIAAFSNVDPEEELRRLECLQQGWAKRSRSATLAQTTSHSHFIKGFRAQTLLHSDDFDRLQDAGGVKLGLWHRAQVQKLLRAYEVLKHGVVTRHSGEVQSSEVRKLKMRLGKIVEMIRANWDQWSKIAEGSGMTLEEELRHLECLWQNCLRLQHSLPRGRKAKDLMLPGLLFGLETIFTLAGGSARGIARSDSGERQGPFLNFMFEALGHLPNDLRPRRKQALGSMWERIFQQRKKGDWKGFDWSRDIRIVENIALLGTGT